MNSSAQYDFIICGAGCAGLSLLMHMIGSGKFGDKKILLIDKEEKTKNDRTWCFWETQPGLFEDIVFKKWQKMWYYDADFSRLLEIAPYEYKMIRGVDFYHHCFNSIKEQINIEVLFGQVQDIRMENNKAAVSINGEIKEATYVFNSILSEKPPLRKNEYFLLQHFKGWIVDTVQPVFNPQEATMMDFRVSQQEGTTFVYVMPFTNTKALIEYTLFSKTILPKDQYNDALKNYLKQYLNIENYTLLEEEFGIIPMTNHRFPSDQGKIINIGTAGGQTKTSSGYTFKFIQKHSKAIVDQLVKTGNPFTKTFSGRHHFYDSVLLHILFHRKLSAPQIFTPIIKKNKPQDLLRFMDNESSLSEDLKIISALPAWPFLKAALKQL